MADTPAKKTTRKPDDESDLIDSMDILADLDVLSSEPDWRMLNDTASLDKYIKQTSDAKQGESHD